MLWDPTPHGRRYARTQKLMAATAEGDSDAGGLTVAGIRFTPETLTGLSRLRIRPADLPPGSSRAPDRGLGRRLARPRGSGALGGPGG